MFKALHLMLLALFALAACEHKIKFDESQYDSAVRILAQFEADLGGMIRGESAAWRSQLDAMQAKLTEDAKDVVANQVRDVLAGTTARLGQELKSTVQNFEERLKANAYALLKALGEARGEIEEARKKKEPAGPVVMRALERVMKTRAFLDPCVTQFIPPVIRVQREGRVKLVPVAKTLEVHGWGFLRPFEEAGRFHVTILSAPSNGASESRDVPVDALATSTDYMMQLRLADFEFRKSDRWLALTDSRSGTGPLKVAIEIEEGGSVQAAPAAAERGPIAPPRPVITLVRMVPHLQITAPRKHENYGIKVELVDASNTVRGGADNFWNSNKTFLEKDAARDLVALDVAWCKPGDTITVRVRSAHLEGGTQFEGRWAAKFGVRCVFTDATPGQNTRDIEKDCGVSSELTFEHQGGIFQPNHREVTQEFRVTVPRL
jgi:hypothetical protein